MKPRSAETRLSGHMRGGALRILDVMWRVVVIVLINCEDERTPGRQGFALGYVERMAHMSGGDHERDSRFGEGGCCFDRMMANWEGLGGESLSRDEPGREELFLWDIDQVRIKELAVS